jgi:hypothetical protein
LSLRGVISLSILFHSGVGLAHIGGHARAPAESHKLGVYDSDGVSYLSCARGFCIFSPGGGGGGYVMACVTFYEQELGVPPHQFLHSLLQFYGLELHHLTPSGILHMATFVTLC